MECFSAVVQATGGGGHAVELPFDVPAVLGGRRVPVRGTVAGAPFRSTVAVYGGRFYLGLNRELREAAGDVGPGDTVTVEIERDDEPRTVEVPAELQAVLDADASLRRAFDALSHTHRREYAEWVGEAKRAETRARRAARTAELLQASAPA